ncbi:hypothetical protein N7457_001333 [Penicillium paradoxum]|uniref:uncharacterized protein n=1 Tax=Penicillium paradoxum TaxID=176176 RepID=UPI0025492A22|nr:uncharacterized protein N7457_001333 [Penicillium paradoxum]KAJ5794734.1 hypothetical protein N7457_001333 [Penicillium paradoxum]
MTSSQPVKIYQNELNEPTTANVFIGDVKHLSSYNWLERSTPTIAVPGLPNEWISPSHPIRVRLKRRLIFIDQNAYRLPRTPLEPLFRALYIENPTFDIGSVHVVADDTTIRKFLSFVAPDAEKSFTPFRVRAELVKETLLFTRVETESRTYIRPEHPSSYSRSFIEKSTERPTHECTSHYRIISYNFAGLKFLIRHESDAYIPAQDSDASSTHSHPTQERNTSPERGRSRTRSQPPQPLRIPGSHLEILKVGEVVPRETTIEIQTRNYRTHLTPKDVAAKMWVSRVPNLVRAFYQDRDFNVPTVEDVRDEVMHWQTTHQVELCHLGALLNRIYHGVKRLGGGGIITTDTPGEVMTIEEAETGNMLPRDLYSRWD